METNNQQQNNKESVLDYNFVEPQEMSQLQNQQLMNQVMANPLAMMGNTLEMETHEMEVPNDFFKKQEPQADQSIALNTTNQELIDTTVDFGEPIQLQTYPDLQTSRKSDEDQPLTMKQSPQKEEQKQQQQPQLNVVRNKVRFWHVEYYRCYFDVTTREVQQRFLEAVWPFRKLELSQSPARDIEMDGTQTITESTSRPIAPVNPLKKQYDLWGPMWLMFSLIVQVTIIGFLNHQINVTWNIEAAESIFSVSKVSSASSLICTCFILSPLIVNSVFNCCMKISALESSFLNLFSIFGYSYTAYMITNFFSLLQFTLLKYLMNILALVIQLFYLKNKLSDKEQIIEEFITAHPNDTELIRLYGMLRIIVCVIQTGFAFSLSIWF